MGPDSQGTGSSPRRREGDRLSWRPRHPAAARTPKAHPGRRPWTTANKCFVQSCPAQNPGLGFPPDVSATAALPPRLNFQGSNAKVGCQSGPRCTFIWHIHVEARLVPLGGSIFFAFRDELQRAAKYSESGLPRLGAIVQELMAQPIAASATGHLQGLRSTVLQMLGHTVSVDGLSECRPWGGVCVLRAAGEQLIATLGAHVDAWGMGRAKAERRGLQLLWGKRCNPRAKARTALPPFLGWAPQPPMHPPFTD